METRSGSNRFSGSVYNTWRNQAGTNEEDALKRENSPSWLWGLNTPYWYNKRDIPKTKAGDYFINDVRLQTPGFRVGGPIVKDKLFYFFNYEEFRLPESRKPHAVRADDRRAGRQLHVRPCRRRREADDQPVRLSPASKGQTSTIDPSIAKLLADIRTAAASDSGGAYSALANNNVEAWNYSPSATQKRRFPTVRVDYNLTNAHRLGF